MTSEKVGRKIKPGRGGKRLNAGRKRGTPNKVTADVRQAFSEILQRNAASVEGWIQDVSEKDPYKAVDLMLRLAEYHIPKLARSELTGAGGGPVIVRMDELDAKA